MARYGWLTVTMNNIHSKLSKPKEDRTRRDRDGNIIMANREPNDTYLTDVGF